MVPKALQQHLRGTRGGIRNTAVQNVGQTVPKRAVEEKTQQSQSPVQDVQRAIQSRHRLL